MRFLDRQRDRRIRDIVANQDVLDDTGCWACSRSPVTIKGQTCGASGCERAATNALGYYWNPSPGLGGRKVIYLCAEHGVDVAGTLFDDVGKWAILP